MVSREAGALCVLVGGVGSEGGQEGGLVRAVQSEEEEGADDGGDDDEGGDELAAAGLVDGAEGRRPKELGQPNHGGMPSPHRLMVVAASVCPVGEGVDGVDLIGLVRVVGRGVEIRESRCWRQRDAGGCCIAGGAKS